MNKSIFITGSTDGIGKLTAIKFAQDGQSIYLHGRNQKKLSSVISEIKEISGNEKIKGFSADLSDLESVTKMALEIKDNLTTIDVLINNAGVYKSQHSTNKDGLDTRFVVNYLAPYFLTAQLIPILEKGDDPRIINLSSAAQSSITLDALAGKVRLSDGEAYAQSKLAITMWSLKLAKELNDISVIAVNPGSLLNTKMVKEAFGNHWSSADKGADILYKLAVSADCKGVTGKYFDNDRGAFGEAHPDAYDETKIEMLIDATENEIIKK